MAIPQTVRHYLEDAHIGYGIVRHPPSETSWQSAARARVDATALAKAVLLCDRAGYLLAVLPATRSLDLDEVERETGRHLALALEEELSDVFQDCEFGAVPAIGPAYGLETLVAEELRSLPEVYVEAGDHEELLMIEGPSFVRMLPGAKFGAFTYPS